MPRPEMTGALSDEQWQLFKVISSTEGYFTVETLRLQVGLPLHVIRQGIQLFASLGLIQFVRLPDRPMRNVLVYVPAYRNLAEADRAKELDLGLLARSITSTLHGFDPLESEVLP